MRKILFKLSALFLKAHQYLQKRLKNNDGFVPYNVRMPAATGSTRIIHFNGNFIVGGSSQLIVDIIENTSDLYDHSIIVPQIPDPLPYQPLKISEYGLGKMMKLSDFLKNDPPAAVHIHYWIRQELWYTEAAIWYRAVFEICAELNIPVIQNVNVPTKPFHAGTVEANVFVSNYVRDNFNNSSVPAHVVYPGSDFSHFKQSDKVHQHTIGMVYRLDPDKLNAEAIEVFIKVAKLRPDITCYIVGSGHFLKEYKRRVTEEQLESRFIFPGMISYKDLPQWYSKIGIFVTPVHDESFGQVTPFAMNMGIPVAGYNTGALSEILGSDETLVEYGDIEGLANRIINLIDDPQKLERLSCYNQERATEKFSLEAMIEGYRAIYQKYIAR